MCRNQHQWINWTALTTTGMPHSSSGNDYPSQVLWNGTTYCSLTQGGSISRAGAAATAWTTTTMPAGNDGPWSAMTWTGSYFVAVSSGAGSYTIFATSPDCAIWTSHTVSLLGYWGGVASNGSISVAVGGNSDTYLTSTDGISWAPHSYAMHNSQHIAWNGTHFLVDGGNFFGLSTDGINWTSIPSAGSSTTYGGIVGDTRGWIWIDGYGPYVYQAGYLPYAATYSSTAQIQARPFPAEPPPREQNSISPFHWGLSRCRLHPHTNGHQ